MNGKNPNLLSCVGAMKIARNVAVFGWYDEWYGPFPFIGVLAEIRGWRAIFIAPTKLKSFLHSTTHRGTLPQSRPLGVTAPSGREPGCGLYHSSNRQETGALRAIFIAPTNGVFNSIRRPETGALNM